VDCLFKYECNKWVIIYQKNTNSCYWLSQKFIFHDPQTNSNFKKKCLSLGMLWLAFIIFFNIYYRLYTLNLLGLSSSIFLFNTHCLFISTRETEIISFLSLHITAHVWCDTLSGRRASGLLCVLPGKINLPAEYLPQSSSVLFNFSINYTVLSDNTTCGRPALGGFL